MGQKSESRAWRVLVVNPGSTSTKVGLFDGEKPVFTVNVAHEAAELAKFAGVSDQLPYRLGLIEAALGENGVVEKDVVHLVGASRKRQQAAAAPDEGVDAGEVHAVLPECGLDET